MTPSSQSSRSPASRLGHRLGAIACAVLLLAAARTDAQALPTAGINDAASNMASGDREKVMAARVWLINQLSGKERLFLAGYAKAVATALMPVANGNDAHAKLNAAIVVQRIADQSGSTDLIGIVAKLIRDPSPAVATYGIRATGAILPRAMADVNVQANNPLVPSILEAVNRHPTSEAVISEAYSQMTRLLSQRDAADLIGQPAVASAIPKTIDALHALLAIRVKQFGPGSVTEPAAETPAVSFLSRSNTWAASSKAQQMNTLRLLMQLMNGAIAEMESVPAGAQASARDRLNALRGLVRGTAQGMSVLAELAGSAELKGTIDRAKENWNAGTPVQVYKQGVLAIQNDLVRIYPELKNGAADGASGGATQPAR